MNKDLKEKEIMYIKIASFALLIYFVFANIGYLWKTFLLIFAMLSPFISGLMISYVVNIPMRWLEKKHFAERIQNRNLRRAFSLITSYILVILIISIILIFIIPQLMRSIANMGFRIPVAIDLITNKLKEFEFTRDFGLKLEDLTKKFNYSDILMFLADFFKIGSSNGINQILGTISSIFSKTVNIILALVFSIYALASKEQLLYQIKRVIYSYIKEEVADKIFFVLKISNDSFKAFISGRFIDAVIIGLITYISLIIFAIPYSSIVALAVGVTNVIPMVGPFIGAGFGIIMILIVSPIKSLIFLILILIIQQLDGNFIFPKIAGKSMGLPAIWTLLAVTLGGGLFGIIGIMLFVPIFNIVYKLLAIDTKENIDKKGLKLEKK